MKNEIIKDSGSKQEFETGAHRDNATGKGRCDFLPLKFVSMVMDDDPVLLNIHMFMETREVGYLADALRASVKTIPSFGYLAMVNNLEESGIEMGNTDYPPYMTAASLANMMLEVSKHYEAGAIKYGANNWQLGMPVNRYIDSGVRHYLKTLRGDIDEPHYRGFIWNLLCAMWTAENKPELNFKEEPER